jgi:hypothetical protein
VIASTSRDRSRVNNIAAWFTVRVVTLSPAARKLATSLLEDQAGIHLFEQLVEAHPRLLGQAPATGA